MNAAGNLPTRHFNTDPNLDGIQLITDYFADDTTDPFDKGFQLSMIFIGLREYIDTSYPGQTLYQNNFKYNFINKFVRH